MSDTPIYDLLNQYLITDLTDLENLLENEVLFLHDKSCRVSIKLEKVYIHNVLLEEIIKYSNYFYKWEECKPAYFQKINYEDFLPFQSDYLEFINEGLLWPLENEIIKETHHSREKHLVKGNSGENLLIDIIEKIKENHDSLKGNFNENNDYIINHYKSSSLNPTITKAMLCVLQCQKNFKERFLKEFPSIKENENNSSSYPDFFKSLENYEKFRKYLEANSESGSQYKVIGYVLKRMQFEKRIHKISDMEFAFYLKDNQLITEDVYQQIIEKNQFDSLKKSLSKERKTSYNLIFAS